MTPRVTSTAGATAGTTGLAPLTARGRATRQRIVEATAHRILAGGIGGTSLDDVRAETLTSKSQLFHYFPGGKAELVRAVAVWEAGELMAAQEPEIHDLSTPGSWQRWRAGLEAYYFGLGRWACPIGSLAAQAAMTDPELEQLVGEGMAQWRGLLADGMRRVQSAGHLPVPLDPVRFAASVLAAIQGGLLLCQTERAPWPLDAALDSALAVLGSMSGPTVEDEPVGAAGGG